MKQSLLILKIVNIIPCFSCMLWSECIVPYLKSGKYHSVTVSFSKDQKHHYVFLWLPPVSLLGASVEAEFVDTIAALFPITGTCLNKETLIRGNDNCDKLPSFHVYLLFLVLLNQSEQSGTARPFQCVSSPHWLFVDFPSCPFTWTPFNCTTPQVLIAHLFLSIYMYFYTDSTPHP